MHSIIVLFKSLLKIELQKVKSNLMHLAQVQLGLNKKTYSLLQNRASDILKSCNRTHIDTNHNVPGFPAFFSVDCHRSIASGPISMTFSLSISVNIKIRQ